MDDVTLLREFESATISADDWHHREHIRAAYLYLRAFGFEEALRRMRESLERLNTAHQTPAAIDRGYHETLTVAWLRVVAATVRAHGAAETSEAFCDAQPHLMQRTLMRLYYTRERIVTWEAKRTFVAPDISPLPAP